MSAFVSLTNELVTRLAWTSVQASLLIGAIWLAGRYLPRLSAATHSLLWWLLGLQLLLGVAVPTPVSLALLSPHAPEATAPAESSVVPPSEHRIANFNVSTYGTTTDALSAPTAVHTSARPMTTQSWHWQRVVLAVWLAGVLVQLVIAARQWREARAVVRASRPLLDPALLVAYVQQAESLGLRHCPQLRVSDEIRSPQVCGLLRPTVLLPTQQGLSAEETSLALAHELTHLRRGDLWMGWVPAMAQRLFFFHPLVNWAMREYALHREAACDAQVMQEHGAAPQAYGRLLLRLGVSHPLLAGLASASPTFLNLKRRLTMLQQSANPTSRVRSWLLVAAIAAVGVLPYRVTEAKPDPTDSSAQPAVAASSAVKATPAVAPTPAVQAAPAPLSRIPPAPPAPPAPPVPPAPPADVDGFAAHHVHIDTHTDAAYGFALLDRDSVTINGSDLDLKTAQNLRNQGEPLVMFRHGGQSYVIRDPAYVARAKSAYAPVSELATQQGRLGGEQGRLGGEQGGIGAREGALGMREGALAQREAMIASQQARGVPADQLAGERAGIQAQRAEIARERSDLTRQQKALARQQAELGKQQAALSRRQQEATAQANEQMNRLLEEALSKGVAKPLQ